MSGSSKLTISIAFGWVELRAMSAGRARENRKKNNKTIPTKLPTFCDVMLYDRGKSSNV